MKKIILSLICILLLTSCKNDEGKQYEEMAKKM